MSNLIFLAMQKPSSETSQRIVDSLFSGDDINVQDKLHGSSPLHWAIANINIDTAMLLITVGKDYHIDLDIQDLEQKTPLHLACLKGYHRKNLCLVINCLLAHGANPNIQDFLGNTPLHYAILKRDLALIQKLLDARASLEIKNNLNQTPKDLLSITYEQHLSVLNTLRMNSSNVCTYLSKEEWLLQVSNMASLLHINPEELPLVKKQLEEGHLEQKKLLEQEAERNYFYFKLLNGEIKRVLKDSIGNAEGWEARLQSALGFEMSEYSVRYIFAGNRITSYDDLLASNSSGSDDPFYVITKKKSKEFTGNSILSHDNIKGSDVPEGEITPDSSVKKIP